MRPKAVRHMEAIAENGRPSAFLWSKMASLLAFAPLGVWTLIHVWNNLAVFSGSQAWEASVTGHDHPVAVVATSIVVLAPLLIHTVWGVGRLLTSRPNNVRYGYFANLKYLLQRASAIGVMGFLGAHVWLAYLHPRLVEGHGERFADISQEMHQNPATLVVYLLGTLGVAYHLGNGLYGFAWNWGLAASRKSVARFETAGIALFALMLVGCWAAIYGLWAAGA